jgi:hypothetical protein
MIACLFYRRVIARCIDASEALPEKAQGHVRNCPACRQFYELERELTRRLVAGAARRHQSPPPFLHAKIMASLHRRPETAERVPKFLHPVWAAALIIVALGLFGAALIRPMKDANGQRSHRPDQTIQTKQFAAPSPAIPNPLHIFTTNAAQVASRNLSEWSHALDEPLEVEMQSVVTDAKAALQLLAQNFLPDRDPGAAPR